MFLLDNKNNREQSENDCGARDEWQNRNGVSVLETARKTIEFCTPCLQMGQIN